MNPIEKFIRLLPPFLLTGALLFSLCMLLYLHHALTYDFEWTLIAVLFFILTVAVYWSVHWRKRKDAASYWGFVIEYARAAAGILLLVTLWAMWGLVSHAAQAYFPDTFISSSKLSPYQSHQVFVRAMADPLDEAPRFLLSIPPSHTATRAHFHNSAIFQTVSAQTRQQDPGVVARKLRSDELEELIKEDRKLAIVSHADGAREAMVMYWIALPMTLIALLFHLYILRTAQLRTLKP